MPTKPVEATPLVDGGAGSRRLFACGLAVLGPGFLASLADTDAACLLVAGDSGARYGFSFLILLQMLLVFPLFLAQELTVRLGVHTGQGHGACIRQHFGPIAGWFAFGLLAVSTVPALVSEMSGIAGVASLAGLPPTVGAVLAAVAVLALIYLAPYHYVEMVGLGLGMFEASFLFAWGLARPSASSFFGGLGTFDQDREFANLAVGGVGAVIMPWMIYFQQSAVAARALSTDQAEAVERTGTLVGSCASQLVMIATMTTMAASREVTGVRSVQSVSDMGAAMDGALGAPLGRVLLGLGVLGGAMCGTIVISLATAWALCDACGLQSEAANAMELPPHRAPAFYASFAAVTMIGLLVTLCGATGEGVSMIAMLANALLMPITLAFLLVLASGPALPQHVRVSGPHKLLCTLVFAAVCIFSLVAFGMGLTAASPSHSGELPIEIGHAHGMGHGHG